MTYLIKNKKYVYDVIKMALPAIGEMCLYMLIWTTDTILIGRYGGEEALSAVTMSSQFLYTFVEIVVTIGIAVAITSLIARLNGAGNKERCEEVATHGVILTIIFSIILFCMFFFLTDHILGLFNAQGRILKMARSYMRITSFAVFFNMIIATLNGIQRGVGNTRIPLYASMILVIINLGLDYVLIFGINGTLRLGIKGAAIATTLANFISLLYLIYMFIRNSSVRLRLLYIRTITVEKVKQILFLAIPSGMQEGAFSICRLLNSMMIYTIGTTAFAANQIAVSVESISFMPGWGVAVAATSLVGNKIGEGKYDEAKIYGDICLLVGSFFMGLCGLAFLIFPYKIGGVFLGDDSGNVLEIARVCIMIASIEQIPTGISMIGGGIIKGMGDTKSPFLIALFSNWIIRMPLMIIFVLVLKLDVKWVWYITSIQWSVDAFLVIKNYRSKMTRVVSGEGILQQLIE